MTVTSMIFSLCHNPAFRRSFVKDILTYASWRQMHTMELSEDSYMQFKNPCLDLQEYLETPVIKDICFDVSVESMKYSMELFVPNENNKIVCIAKTIDPKKFPCHELPEVALLGRSNSGKSSILKAIFKSAPELRIQSSKKPGHTKSLCFYQVGSHLCLVDMPGYGFRQPEWFKTSVIPYLKNRKNLVKAVLLIDAKESFHSWDDASLQMLADLKTPFVVALTKIDLIPNSERVKNYLHIRNILQGFPLNTLFPQIFMLSTRTFEGLAYFTAFIAHVTGNLPLNNS